MFLWPAYPIVHTQNTLLPKNEVFVLLYKSAWKAYFLRLMVCFVPKNGRLIFLFIKFLKYPSFKSYFKNNQDEEENRSCEHLAQNSPGVSAHAHKFMTIFPQMNESTAASTTQPHHAWERIQLAIFWTKHVNPN